MSPSSVFPSCPPDFIPFLTSTSWLKTFSPICNVLFWTGSFGSWAKFPHFIFYSVFKVSIFSPVFYKNSFVSLSRWPFSLAKLKNCITYSLNTWGWNSFWKQRQYIWRSLAQFLNRQFFAIRFWKIPRNHHFSALPKPVAKITSLKLAQTCT